MGAAPALDLDAQLMLRVRDGDEDSFRVLLEKHRNPVIHFVYRMVQEALNNANRHAHAKNVIVELKQSANSISVKIEDDGSGFDPKRTRGMGLLGMEERVKRLGGSINIESRPGTRTVIRAELPIEPNVASSTPA